MPGIPWLYNEVEKLLRPNLDIAPYIEAVREQLAIDLDPMIYHRK